MSAAATSVPVDADGRGQTQAPSLPVEAPLVRAVRALEALKGQADLVLLLLEHCSDDAPQIEAAISGAIAKMNAASEACWQLAQIKSCKGQA